MLERREPSKGYRQMNTTADKPLFRSAQRFLAESLDDAAKDKLDFAIIHAVTATELILKQRLATLNAGLILENIDGKARANRRTVGLGAIPNRLANLGAPLTQAQSKLIAEFAGWRNQIIHNVAVFDPATVRSQLPQLLDFIASFFRTEFGEPLESFLPRRLFNVASRLVADWKTAVSIAQANAVNEGAVLADACPHCGSESVMSLRDDNAVHCHLCKAALYRLDNCDGCGKHTVTSYSLTEGENFCDQCIEDAGDRYIQMQTDIARGK